MPKKENKKLMKVEATLSGENSINNLILFSIYSVTKGNEKCTFERLAKECFDLFPTAFCFSRYSQWPDSRKLDRPLRILRERKLIGGSPKTFFSLTKAGKAVAEAVGKTLRQRKLKL